MSAATWLQTIEALFTFFTPKRRQQAEAEGKQQLRDREADRENNCRRREEKKETQRKQVDRYRNRNRNSDRDSHITVKLSVIGRRTSQTTTIDRHRM
ncbi:hypothetical protein WR25_15737 [Diploscapter pachys]|uniref:Uncharacterized protein n=1 Tax=Diploscapter pachys TaxID=2018661 RepID=A0A2A2KYN9_9BILA|nr:hypothetical protein WR25_15737 [Diploscapter pachys]